MQVDRLKASIFLFDQKPKNEEIPEWLRGYPNKKKPQKQIWERLSHRTKNSSTGSELLGFWSKKSRLYFIFIIIRIPI